MSDRWIAFQVFYLEEQQSDGERGWMIEVDDEEGVTLLQDRRQMIDAKDSDVI